MEIIKRINNNVSLTVENGQTMIVTGKGVGFKVYPGDTISTDLVEQRYILQNDDISKYSDMLSEIPKEVLDVSKMIVDKAESVMGKVYPTNFVFSLADHLAFIEQRMLEKQMIEHPLTWEIQNLYPREFQMGNYAVELLKERLEMDVPQSEALFIAMHFICYIGEESNDYDFYELIEMIGVVIKKIEERFNQEIDKESTSYIRFSTHLRYYIFRLMKYDLEAVEYNEIFDAVQRNYPDEYACATDIAEYFDSIYGTESTESEKFYLSLHINRLLLETKRRNKNDK